MDCYTKFGSDVKTNDACACQEDIKMFITCIMKFSGRAGQEPKLLKMFWETRERRLIFKKKIFLLWWWYGVGMSVLLCRQGLAWFEIPIDIKGRNIQAHLLAFPDMKQKGKAEGWSWKAVSSQTSKNRIRLFIIEYYEQIYGNFIA